MGLMESMACGIPVVTTRVGMAEDVIQANIPGEISCEIDASMLANKVELVLDTFYKILSVFGACSKGVPARPPGF